MGKTGENINELYIYHQQTCFSTVGMEFFLFEFYSKGKMLNESRALILFLQLIFYVRKTYFQKRIIDTMCSNEDQNSPALNSEIKKVL